MTKRELSLEMQPPSGNSLEDWMPNVVKVSLTDDLIEKVESAIAKGSGKKLLPENSLRFFIVLDWVDRSIRKPGSLSRGAYRVKREPCADRVLRPTVAATFSGLEFSAYFEEHRVWLKSEPIEPEAFRAKVRDMRAREMAASIGDAMSDGGGDSRPPRTKGPAPL